ncbi:MAG: glycyl-radical enzyme activating protein [Solobacterium sp.]|nr:glycyl-radical enzyme activating protein [Solobacterium sp.]
MSSLPVFNIERFAIHDGPGIRTAVFLQGCGLSCRWCANPESQKIGPHLMFLSQKCIGCGQCAAVCPNGVPVIKEGKAQFDRARCVNCGTCVEGCLGDALKISGKAMEPEEIFDTVIRDKDYYDSSQGGVTLSGGEALLHINELIPFIHLCREHQIPIATETCGYVSESIMKTALDYIDLFLFDLKSMNPERFRENTGGDLSVVLRSFQLVAEHYPERIIVRIPVIPEFNHSMEDIKAILSFACSQGVKRADLLPYHTLGMTKYRQLGIPYPYPVETGLKEDDLLPYLKIGEELGMTLRIGG